MISHFIRTQTLRLPLTPIDFIVYKDWVKKISTVNRNEKSRYRIFDDAQSKTYLCFFFFLNDESDEAINTAKEVLFHSQILFCLI